MNFYKVHHNRTDWNYTMIGLVLLLPLNAIAAFHSGLDTVLGIINLLFAILWVCVLLFQISHKPSTAKAGKPN